MGQGTRSHRRAYAVSFVAALGVVLLSAFHGFYPWAAGTALSLTTAIFGGAALVSAAYSLKKYRFDLRDKFSRVWFGFAFGVGLWLLGDFVWEAYTVFYNVAVPFPSVADAFYLGGYVAFILALALYVRIFQNALTRARVFTVWILIAAVAFLISWAFIAPTVTEVADLLTRVFDFAYPTLDLVMLSFAILGFFVLRGGTLARSWLLLLVAMVLEVAGDLSFDYLTATGSYYNGSFNEAFYAVAYITFALAFYIHREEM